MSITRSSRLLLVDLQIKKDNKNFIVEDNISGNFFEMPEICIDAIHLIQNGDTLGEIEKKLLIKYPTDEVNLIDFAKQLVEFDLIKSIDGLIINKGVKSKKSLGFLWIPPIIGRIFFNKISLIIYSVLLLTNLYLFTSYPSLFPTYKDLFIFNYLFLNILAYMILSFILVLFHEIGHVLAMRSFDLPTKLGIGHRLFIVVFETDMSSVWKLPSKDRNVLYLAGLCFDTVLLFFALISQLIFPHESEILVGITRVAVLDIFIRMLYQSCIYMKTDLYYVFENVTGCYNLMENAQQLLSKWLPFKRQESKGEVVFAEERRTVFLYSIFYFIGVGVTLLLFAVFYLPQLMFALKRVLPGFSAGPASLPFWDAALFSLQLLIGLSLLLYSWRKQYRQGHSTSN